MDEGLLGPVLDFEAGNSLEVAEVTGQARGVAGETDGGDAEVERAAAES